MSFGFAFSFPAYSKYGGNGGEFVGASLVLDFAYMENKYTIGATLDVNLLQEQYAVWQAPTGVQGRYFIWEGYAPWEPSLNLDFISQYYQQQN